MAGDGTDDQPGDGRAGGPTDIDAIPTHVTQVLHARALTPGVRRLTLGGGGLERVELVGPDSFVYVLLPPPGRIELTVGTGFRWSEYFALPEPDRPVGAYYTVRHHRPERGEVDLDVVLHGGPGPAAAWAATAAPGDPVALWGPRTAYAPPPDTESFLLVADDTGLPAAAAIAASLAPHQRAHLVVEVADAGERQELTSPAALTITWLHRDGTPPGRTTNLADEVGRLAPPVGPTYVWGGGESRAMTAVRRHVRWTWGLPRRRVSLTPYWRHADRPPPSPEDDP